MTRCGKIWIGWEWQGWVGRGKELGVARCGMVGSGTERPGKARIVACQG